METAQIKNGRIAICIFGRHKLPASLIHDDNDNEPLSYAIVTAKLGRGLCQPYF